MKKLFRSSAKPPKPTPLPPPDPVAGSPPPGHAHRAQYPHISTASIPPSSQQQPLAQTPTSIHGVQVPGRQSVLSQQSNSGLPSRGGSQDSPSADTWVVIENQDPTLIRPQPSFESRSSSLASLPPGASPPNPYPQPPAANYKAASPQPQQIPLQSQQQLPQQPHPQSPQLNNTRRSFAGTRGPSDPANGSSPYIQQTGNSSNEHLYEASLMSGHEKPKKGGFFGWVSDLHDQQKEREKQRHYHAQSQTGQNGEWDLTRIMGFVTATASEDWTLVLEVCERASANEAGAKEAARALKNEFKYAEPPAMLSAARLWAIMLRNTQPIFIVQCNSKKFLETVEEALVSDRTSPVVKERLLLVLAGAAYQYGGDERYSNFRAFWKRVRAPGQPSEGIPFDPADAMFTPPSRRLPKPHPHGSTDSQRPSSIATLTNGPPMHHGPPGVQPQSPYPPPRESREYDRERTGSESRHHRERSERDREYRDRRGHRGRDDRYIIPPEEDIRRLFEECEMAKGNAQVLSSNLAYARPEDLKSELIREFHSKCKRSQDLIIAQIPWASAGADRARQAQAQALAPTTDADKPVPPTPTVEEELLSALLQANQELVEAFRIYDELEALGAKEEEEREVRELSKTQVRLDRTQIQYYSPDGSFMTAAPNVGDRSGPSRSPSPAPTPSSRNHHPLPPLPPGNTGLTSTVPFQNTVHSNHSHGTLAPPPGAPHGPRSPSMRSRSPSPDPDRERHTSLNGSRLMNGLPPRTDKAVDGLERGMVRLVVNSNAAEGYRKASDANGDSDDEIKTPIRPSAKALGKRRASPPPEDDLESSDINRAGTPLLASDHGSDSDPDGESKRPPVVYAYDAAAEREKERQRMLLTNNYTLPPLTAKPTSVANGP